jgi:hypothetical protein
MAVSVAGESLGTVTCDDDSTASWGWRGFIGRLGLEEGDFLRAVFDIGSRKVVIEVGGSELLEAS